MHPENPRMQKIEISQGNDDHIAKNHKTLKEAEAHGRHTKLQGVKEYSCDEKKRSQRNLKRKYFSHPEKNKGCKAATREGKTAMEEKRLK